MFDASSGRRNTVVSDSGIAGVVGALWKILS